MKEYCLKKLKVLWNQCKLIYGTMIYRGKKSGYK